MNPTPARRFYAALEPLATTVYFAPEAEAEFGALGLDPTQSYFSSRAAPMGRAAPETVAAAFFFFHPDMVRLNLRWDLAEPGPVLEARLRAASSGLRRILADESGGIPNVVASIPALRRLVEACDVAGRTLAASHAALDWPDDPLAAVWHAATVLREHRGDGHIAVLVSHGISPVEALTLDAAQNRLKPERHFRFRRWSEEEHAAAVEHLRDRGFLDDGGALTDGGGKFREMIETDTDRLAARPYGSLTGEEHEALLSSLAPLVQIVCERRAVPRYVAALAGHFAG